MKSEFAKYSMQGTGRAVLGVPALAVAGFVGRDAAHSLLAKAASNGAGLDAQELQASVDHVNYHLQSYLLGPNIIERCSEVQPDNQSAYVQCAKDEISTVLTTIEFTIAVGAAAIAIPALNKAWAYFSLASNAQSNNLVHNFMGLKNKTPDANEYDPRFDPESKLFDPDAVEIEEVAERLTPRIIAPSAFATDHSFEIKNGVSPTAEIVLQPGDVVYAEKGSLLSMDSGIDMNLVQVKNAGSLFSGESPLQAAFTNEETRPQTLIITPKTQGEIVEIDMSVEGRILCNNGAFFASYNSVDINFMHLRDKSLRTFSGMGWGVQEVIQSEGEPARVLLTSSGQVHERELGQGETISVQGNAVLAMSQSVKVSLRELKGGVNRLFGGEGKFLLNIEGPGKVWMSTKAEPPEAKEGSGVFGMIRQLLPGG